MLPTNGILAHVVDTITILQRNVTLKARDLICLDDSSKFTKYVPCQRGAIVYGRPLSKAGLPIQSV
jgi:hypothetical protein